MTDFVKFGVIGLGGAWSFHKTGNKNVPEIKFTAACDLDEKKVKRAAKFAKLEAFTNLDEFLKSDIDAVLILAPHFLHKDLVVAAAEAGKHVLCEKPMAPTLEECDEMIAATNKAGVKFMIAENHRFLPAHVMIKDLVSKGLIGEVFLGRAYEGAFCPADEFMDPNRWNFTYDKGGGGVVADQGVHKFTMLNWLLGKVDSAQAWLGKAMNSPPTKGEDNAIILLRFKGGAMVTVDLSSITVHPLTNRLELHGTKGTILEDHSWDKPIQVFSSHADAEVKGEFYCPEVDHGAYPQYYTIAAREEDTYFAKCILNNTTPEFTPEQARGGVAVVLLSYLSAKNGRLTHMDELMDVYKSEGTKTILNGLLNVTQMNYQNMKW